MDTNLIITVLSGILIGVLSFVWFGRLSPAKKEEEESTSETAALPATKSERPPEIKLAPAKDVWEERRQKGITIANSTKTVAKKEEKPFGSSYYYAHNSSNSKGGYSDGLRMEDYTMNGPRLLSRNGEQVESEPLEQKDETNDNDETVTEATQSKDALPRTNSVPLKPTRVISKYLWDDSGKDFGSIRIDVVPGLASSESIPWREITPTSVEAILKDDGLKVSVITEDIDYELVIRQLYGPVKKVEVVQKAKRLIVKLYKAEKVKGNLKAWPQPHKRVA